MCQLPIKVRKGSQNNLKQKICLGLGLQKFQAIFRATHLTVAKRGRPKIVPKAVFPLCRPHHLSF